MNSTSETYPSQSLRRKGVDWGSALGTSVTLAATVLILVILAVILGNVALNGVPQLSWRFISTIPKKDFFDKDSAAILPMIIGTSIRVLVMTIFVIPFGVTTAVYLTEYSRSNSWYTRVIRMAINNLAGVPSIVFGLFGAGFFVHLIGGGLDDLLQVKNPVWGKPALIWASLTLAVMTLPVVIVATEESLRSITPGLREASLALGATKLQTILRIVLPNALPGILTGAILAVSRAAGEVAPILFTGAAYYLADLPHALNDQFMDLGYHTYILASQAPNIEKARPILYGTVFVLLLLTFSLNAIAIFARARIRRQMRAGH